jgi:hypothetical protein
LRIECRLSFQFELGLTLSQREQFLGQLVLELGEPPPARADELELALDERHSRFDDPGALAVARALSPLIAQACLVAAFASLLRGGKYHYAEATSPAEAPTGLEPVEPDAPEIPRLAGRRAAEETA